MNFLAKEDELLTLESQKWVEGFSFVAGVDEVGRGPLAGPVVAAAVVFLQDSKIPLVNDSKKLSDKQRLKLSEEIKNTKGVQFSIVELSPEIVDQINILQATHKAMKMAVEKLENVDFALIDGLPVYNFPIENMSVVKGDSKSASIAAASILAKVYRDELMIKYAEEYPGYGFESHKGYGTKKHIEALIKLGVCPIHRKTFAPVRDILNPPLKEINLL